MALGYAIGIPWLGWLGALAAAVTAYIRVLGGTFGLGAGFPWTARQATSHGGHDRGLLLGVGEYLWRGSHASCVEAAAWIIAVGAIVTCGTRIHAIARQLKAR